jgi:uncharacterized protein (TIGR02594 family)
MHTNTEEPLYLALARKNIGERESLGPNDSPFIRKLLASVNGLWLKGQPWCGSAVAFWMQGAGMPFPKDYYRAKAWLEWGEPVLGPLLGAICVLGREGGGHVGIVTGESKAGFVRLLGGNQGDAVKEAWFPKYRVLGYRRPHEMMLAFAPTGEVGELSKSEA